MDHHAQKEIRDYATAIYELVQPLVPHSMEAFMDFRVNAMQLTGPEIEAINSGKEIESPGEKREFLEKLKRLKINIPIHNKCLPLQTHSLYSLPIRRTRDSRKLSKKIQKERDTDVDKIKEKVSDIFRDEQRRMKGYLDEHNKLIKKSDKPKKSRKKSIDFYEK